MTPSLYVRHWSPPSLLFYLKKKKIIYLFLTVLDLCCYMDFSLVAMSRGYPLVAMCGLLIAMASLVGGARAPGHMGSGDVTPRLLSTGSVAVVHRLSCSEAYGIFLDQ